MAVDENDLIVGPVTPSNGVTLISLDFENTGWLADWLEVYQEGSETPLILDTDYTVADAGTEDATITLAVAADGDTAYTVFLVVPLERTSDFQFRGAFLSDPFDQELNRVWQALQGVATSVRRALSVSKTSPTLPPLVFTASETDGRALAFSSDSSQIIAGPTADEIAGAQDLAEEAKTYRDEAKDYRDDAALYDGPKVDFLADVVSVTNSEVAVTGFLRVIENGWLLERAPDAAIDADLDYSGDGGVKWYRRLAWMRQKHLLSADWQPRPEALSAGEAARFQSVLDSIASRHPDLTHGHVLGDLVYEGSVDNTGADPEYGFPEFLEDVEARLPVPLSRMFFMPGNHDRDGTGIGDFQNAWTMRTYRSYFGREYYYTVQGNLLNIYMGDMGGTTGGAITDAVVDWFGDVVRHNKQKNIIVNLHHPLSGTYQGKVEATEPEAVQLGSDRITDILDEVAADADNIVAVFYGHVGSAFQFNDETFHGTRHIQIGMHIPSNVTNTRDDIYYVMDLEHGASSIDIVQWNATDDTEGTTKTLTLAFPLALAPEYDFDGRTATDDLTPVSREHHVVLPLDEYRYDNAGSWEVDTSEIIYGYRIVVEDRSNDVVPNGLEIGYGLDWPGVGSGFSDNPDERVVNSVAVKGVGVTWEYLSGTDVAPDIGMNFYGADDGVIEKMATLNPSNADQPGLHLFNGKFRVAFAEETLGTVDFSSAEFEGVQANLNGRLQCGTDVISALDLQRNGTNGSAANFYKSTTKVGSIDVDGSSTTYNTTSDKRLKEDWREFDGLSVIRELGVWDHAWKNEGGRRSKGVLAQDAKEVVPYAVTRGGDDPRTDPWTVDYSKLVPDLIRAIQQLEQRIKELEGASHET